MKISTIHEQFEILKTIFYKNNPVNNRWGVGREYEDALQPDSILYLNFKVHPIKNICFISLDTFKSNREIFDKFVSKNAEMNQSISLKNKQCFFHFDLKKSQKKNSREFGLFKSGKVCHKVTFVKSNIFNATWNIFESALQEEIEKNNDPRISIWVNHRILTNSRNFYHSGVNYNCFLNIDLYGGEYNAHIIGINLACEFNNEKRFGSQSYYYQEGVFIK